MADKSTDEQLLRRALDLARQGIGLSSPNPHVGAVIVDSLGNIAGTGVYTYEGVKHAEVRALEHAGPKARGGTLYINIEPHSHHGRTPPCTDALIGAGIRRVVACMPDPNPQVSGRGFEKLRVAGIEVNVGIFETQARHLNDAFGRYIRHGVPLVTLKSAMTLDGKIAPPLAPSPLREAPAERLSGVSSREWITGEAARDHVQQQRHESDAILVGIGTILADDPLLTDRSGNPRRRPLLRVILDSRLKLPLQSRIVKSASEKDIHVFCCSAGEPKKGELEARGVCVETMTADGAGRPDIKGVLRRLGQMEITSLMVEGGSAINGAMLASDVVDKVFFYYAPKIMAASQAAPFASKSDLSPNKMLRVDQVRLHSFGEDFAVEGYLRDPFAP